MQVRQGFRQRKPETRARFPGLCRVIRLDERLQNARQVCRGDADARIDNRNFHEIAVRASRRDPDS